MSRSINKEINCPRCHASVDTQMWTCVNVTLEPALRAKIMDESLFEWTCPECGYEAQLIYPCLYHDLDGLFMVYLIPDASRSELADDAVQSQFPELQNIKKRLVSSLNALKEKVLIFEAGLDDMAVELTKLALAEVVAKKQQKTVTSGYFCLADRETNQIGFSFFLAGECEPFYQGTRIEVYDKSMDIVDAHAKEERLKNGFIRIDTPWAAAALDRYKKGIR